jgi:hypothetical protein
VGFAPYRPYPFFRRRAPWPFVWLGCWTAENAVTLDTGSTLSRFRFRINSTGVPKREEIQFEMILLAEETVVECKIFA